MRILVTGHCGYIGPVMVRLFHAANHEVVGFDTGYFRDLIEEASDECLPDFELIGDIRDIDEKIFEGVDGVVHLAALSNDPIGDIAGPQTHSINTDATVRCAELARNAGVKRFVFASSCSIYGASGQSTAPLSENAPLAPVSAYAESKVAAEAGIQALATDAFEVVMLRNATAYGVSPRMRVDLVLANLMATGYATGIIKVLSDGTPWRPLVDIEDISRAALAALEADSATLSHKVFNIGTKTCNYRVKEIAEIVGSTLSDCRVEITGETGNDPRSYKVDFSRALTSLPNFNPQWNLEKGAVETLQWLESHPRRIEQLLGNRYSRLIHLKRLQVDKRIDSAFRWC